MTVVPFPRKRIIPLDEVDEALASPIGRVNPAVIETLEDLLVAAKEGRVIALQGVVGLADGSTSRVVVPGGDYINDVTMLGEVHLLANSLAMMIEAESYMDLDDDD